MYVCVCGGGDNGENIFINYEGVMGASGKKNCTLASVWALDLLGNRSTVAQLWHMGGIFNRTESECKEQCCLLMDKTPCQKQANANPQLKQPLD